MRVVTKQKRRMEPSSKKKITPPVIWIMIECHADVESWKGISEIPFYPPIVYSSGLCQILGGKLTLACVRLFTASNL